MRIGGIERLTLIDFPGKVAATLFTQGCPFRCHFCHNPSLVDPERFIPPFDEESFFTFLKSRVGKLDGVVISGGEPTLQSDLRSFIERIKAMGFLVKLDTSGINPDVLESLMTMRLLDYVAMDVKGPLCRYGDIVGRKIDTSRIERSIDLLMKESVPYEFRTTLLPRLHSEKDFIAILERIKGAKRYALQAFRNRITLNSEYQTESSYSEDELLNWKRVAEGYVEECLVR